MKTTRDTKRGRIKYTCNLMQMRRAINRTENGNIVATKMQQIATVLAGYISRELVTPTRIWYCRAFTIKRHGANINRAQIRYEANENLPQSHRTDETASNDLWSAGSDPKYQHTATRDTGATILKDRKSITEKPGGNEYKSIEAARKPFTLTKYLDLWHIVKHLQFRIQVPWPIMGRAMIIMFPRKPIGAHAVGQAHRSMANNGEDYMRFDHTQHHHASFSHNSDETNEALQFSSANLSGELNRFYEANGGFGSSHHKAVGIDETTASKNLGGHGSGRL